MKTQYLKNGAGCLLLLACGSLLADMTDSTYANPLENPGCFCSSIVGQPAGPTADNSFAVFFTGDALLWQAGQAGLEYAAQANSSGSIVTGKDYIPTFNYKWGFRVGLGWITPLDTWDVSADWTCFHNHYIGSTTPHSGKTLLITDSSNPAFTTVNTASNHLKIALDLIDLNIGKAFYVSSYFALRPHMGVRNAWVNERALEQFTGASLGASSPDTIRFKNNFWGIGGRVGLDTQWLFSRGFSMFGDFASALLSGEYNLSVNEKVGPTQTSIRKVKDNYAVTKAVSDLQLGLRWDSSYCNSWHIGAQIGWEQLFFFNMWQWQNASFSPTPNGDLSFSGWFGSLRLDF